MEVLDEKDRNRGVQEVPVGDGQVGVTGGGGGGGGGGGQTGPPPTPLPDYREVGQDLMRSWGRHHLSAG